MNVIDSQPNPESKKRGLKKLWTKVKAALSAEPSKSQSKTTLPTQNKQTQLSRSVASPVSESTPLIEPVGVRQPESAGKMETQQLAVDSAPNELIVDETSNTIVPAHDAIEVDETEDAQETYVWHLSPMHATDPRRYELPIFTARSTPSTRRKEFNQAQAVYEKYGIPLDITDWQRLDRSSVDRVEKRQRMRVRYTCHSCQNVFGRDKICSRCSHDRGKCTECVRYPAKRVGEKTKSQRIVPVEPTEAPITTGACHECKTKFSIGDKSCQNCEHEICATCLRETILDPQSAASPVQRIPAATAAA